jgi:hypothetical protein
MTYETIRKIELPVVVFCTGGCCMNINVELRFIVIIDVVE